MIPEPLPADAEPFCALFPGDIPLGEREST